MNQQKDCIKLNQKLSIIEVPENCMSPGEKIKIEVRVRARVDSFVLQNDFDRFLTDFINLWS